MRGGGKRSIDIERLLGWVYLDQRADKINLDELRDDLTLRERAGLIAAMERYYAGAGSSGLSGDGLSQCETQGLLGCRVDSSRRLFQGSGYEVDPDAQAVHAALMAIDAPAAPMVLIHGRVGSRPDCMLDARTRYEPIWKNEFTRTPIVVRDPKTHRPLFCPIVLVDDPAKIRRARREYRRWHNALYALAGYFRSQPHLLVRWAVTGPNAPARPWVTTETQTETQHVANCA